MSRLFLQLLNTAMMTVLIHVPFSVWNSMPFGLTPSVDDWPIDGEWYKAVGLLPHTAPECHASKMVNSDTCPRPTTGAPLQLTILVNFAVTPLVSVMKFLARLLKNRLMRCCHKVRTCTHPPRSTFHMHFHPSPHPPCLPPPPSPPTHLVFLHLVNRGHTTVHLHCLWTIAYVLRLSAARCPVPHNPPCSLMVIALVRASRSGR